MPVSISVKRNTLLVKNVSETPVILWKIEFTYYITVPRKEMDKKPETTKKKITEGVRGPITLAPGEAYSLELGLTVESISEITIYYEENRKIYKQKAHFQ